MFALSYANIIYVSVLCTFLYVPFSTIKKGRRGEGGEDLKGQTSKC